jgi:NADH-quinone oxidoreductase subunit D
MRGVGTISKEMAVGFGLTGANLRASGLSFDVRRDRPYAAYEEMDFDIPVAEEGDCYARYLVRMEEMRQATRIVRQCIDGLPEGDFTAKVPKVLRPPAGEAYAAVESPRGELGVYLVSDGSDRPYRMRYRPPALFALQAGEALLPGTLLADAIVILGSVDLVLGEIDR